jgi:hypothetical protein
MAPVAFSSAGSWAAESKPVAGQIALSSLTPIAASNGWGPYETNRSNGKKRQGDGRTLTINGAKFNTGLGVHAPSSLRYALHRAYKSFKVSVGVDDESRTTGSVNFEILVDGVTRYRSPRLSTRDAAVPVTLNLRGALTLQLVVTDGGNGQTRDHADWAGAILAPATVVTAPAAMPKPNARSNSRPKFSARPAAKPARAKAKTPVAVKRTVPALKPTSSPPAPAPKPTVSAPPVAQSPPPAAGAYPNASNTGPAVAGYTSLKAHKGGWHITQPGTYVGYDVSGQLYIDASNVVLKGFNIHGATSGNLVTVNGANAQILDSAIHGDGNSTNQAPQSGLIQVYNDNFVLKRSNLYNSGGDGIRLAESENVLIEDNFIHDWVANPSNSPHYDGIVPGEAGAGPWTIRHNTILMWSPTHMTSVISFQGVPGQRVGPMTIDNNFLAGGGYVISAGGDTNYSGLVFTSNRFANIFSPNSGDYGIMYFTPVWGTKGTQWGGPGRENVFYNASGSGQSSIFLSTTSSRVLSAPKRP